MAETPSITITLLRNEWQAIAKLLEFARDGVTNTDDVPAADYGLTLDEIHAVIRLYSHDHDAVLPCHTRCRAWGRA